MPSCHLHFGIEALGLQCRAKSQKDYYILDDLWNIQWYERLQKQNLPLFTFCHTTRPILLYDRNISSNFFISFHESFLSITSSFAKKYHYANLLYIFQSVGALSKKHGVYKRNWYSLDQTIYLAILACRILHVNQVPAHPFRHPQGYQLRLQPQRWVQPFLLCGYRQW